MVNVNGEGEACEMSREVDAKEVIYRSKRAICDFHRETGYDNNNRQSESNDSDYDLTMGEINFR